MKNFVIVTFMVVMSPILILVAIPMGLLVVYDIINREISF